MANDIKQRVVVEADDAIRTYKDVADATRDLGKTTAEAGHEATGASRALGQLEGSVMGLAKSLAAMVGTQAIMQWFDDLAEKAAKAHEAVAKLGKETGGLAANLGGKLGGEATAVVAGVISDALMSPDDRKQLTDFVGGMSDLRELPDAAAVKAMAEKGARLAKSTGGGISGGDAANLMQMVGARYGLDDDQAVNLISTMANSGFDGATISSIIEKGGDQELMGMMLGARGSGLPRGDIGRKTASMLDAVGGDGEVSPELAALGVTPDMKASQRIRHLMGQDAGAVGKVIGNQNRVLFDALAAADRAGKVGPAMAELADPNAAQMYIDRRMASPFAQAEAYANALALEEEAREVNLGKTGYAEAVAINRADGVPGAGLLSFLSTEKARKSRIQTARENTKGFWGLIPGKPELPTREELNTLQRQDAEADAQSAPPAEINGGRFNLGGDNPFGAAGAFGVGFGNAGGGGAVHNGNNYYNCNINSKDPTKEVDPRTAKHRKDMGWE